jgi:hypothetical protein
MKVPTYVFEQEKKITVNAIVLYEAGKYSLLITKLNLTLYKVHFNNFNFFRRNRII